MRNKIRQLMKKEEGFTLVELLAVIVILGIIVAIAIPSIGGIINRAETGANEAEYALIEDAARLYHIQYEGETALTTVSVDDLSTNGYLDSRDGTKPTGSVNIGGTPTNPTYTYTGRE
ncbi:competence type IV pilus major pilin ComGC [Alkalibacterium sp. 20]|uniref:competence type IV pilus major pilin ComGC n=1 Tax=Alkalibacterium sp. 20 TaxID=1798803 RepID=UPI0008FFF45A|nr:prepilin-type N-terminal cleavage/methylation domain-containing protein [Alkalibacterium sp. 20]OJF90906.1 hypothetical protein AX762_03810 [Alkalibacterium sp. 20]